VLSTRHLVPGGVALALVFACATTAASGNRQTTTWNTTFNSTELADFAYTILDFEERRTFTVGREKDYEAVEVLRKHATSSLVWLRIGNKKYVIDDPEAIREAKRIVKPIDDLSREQSRLGDLQGQLGNEQGKLGNVQGALGNKQGELGHEQGELGRAQSAAAVREDDEAQAEIGEAQEKLAAQQERLGSRQADLGKHQATMGRSQAALGEEQARLGKQQAELQPGVSAKMRALAKDAIADGRARRM
jgi:hypothetical protein